MDTTRQHQSARIYEFPRRGPPSAAAPGDRSATIVVLKTPRVPKIPYGGGWYHDMAIEEAERTATR